MTPHEILGVALDASRADIRAAYRVLAQIYHPDRHASSSEPVRLAAAREMALLNEAYAELTSRTSKAPTSRTAGTSTGRQGTTRPTRQRVYPVI